MSCCKTSCTLCRRPSEPNPVRRRHGQTAREVREHLPRDPRVEESIDLVQDDDGRFVSGAQLLQRLLHSQAVLEGARMRYVNDVDEQVCLDDLLQRGPKSRHQCRGQLLDEPHGVGEQHLRARRQAHPPRGRVERGEQLVRREDVGAATAR